MADSGVIALHGGVNGTIKYHRDGKAYRLELNLRQRIPGALTVCAVSPGGGAAFCDMSRKRTALLVLEDICGAAVYDGNARLLCRGSLGNCSIDSRLGELGIMAVSHIKSASEKPAPGARRTETADTSPVTKEILGRARELFAPISAEKESPPSAAKDGAGDTKPAAAIESKAERPAEGKGGNGKAEKQGGLADGDIYAVPNPFPRTYPNSYWHMRRGENAVYGFAVTPRGKLFITAVPGMRNRRPRGFERFLTDSQGRGMWARERIA